MKTKLTKLLCLLMAGLILLSGLVACGDTNEGTEDKTSGESVTEGETVGYTPAEGIVDRALTVAIDGSIDVHVSVPG